jgi:two-component system phosphate regulon sensor histidine kinase PhoR
MTEGVMVVDSGHVIRLVNDSLCRQFQIKSDPRGQSVLSALREASVEDLIRVTRESGTARTCEISPPHQPASHFSVSAVPLRDAAGVVCVFHDISRLRQLEEVRREFVANVSHELRTPLSIFHGHLENLIDHPALPGEELADVLGILRRHSLRLNALLEDLLALARLESRREEITRSEIEVEPFLRRILKDWRLKLAEKNITASVRVEPGMGHLDADLFRLEQVLGNLMENAVKFTPDGGAISLAAEREEGGAVIRVTDTGIGIPPADLPHVFEPFYRVDKARSRTAGGTGLGLSIVRRIAAMHGGEVGVESVIGSGTTISLRLPLKK